jgi:hypothetical protein
LRDFISAREEGKMDEKLNRNQKIQTAETLGIEGEIEYWERQHRELFLVRNMRRALRYRRAMLWVYRLRKLSRTVISFFTAGLKK